MSRGAQVTGRDERALRTLQRMVEERGAAHVARLVAQAFARERTVEARLLAEKLRYGVEVIEALPGNGNSG